MKADWPAIGGLDSIASPGLLVDADRVSSNTEKMIAMVGGRASRLRPHLKTHKMPEVVRMQIAAGITKFKAATIAEAAMAAQVGAGQVLLAYQPVAENIHRLAELVQAFPGTRFSAISDDLAVAESIAEGFSDAVHPLDLLIDVDCGMHRTGIEMGRDLDTLRSRIESLPGIRYAGLHVYDGHVHSPSLADRQAAAGEIIAMIRRYDQANPSAVIVAGGSPTLACWAAETDWECSPGTTTFWDIGYGASFPDLEFSIAAALLTRVISKPGGDRVCLDLGYKAVASEMPLSQRLVLPTVGDPMFVGHSEEHLVIETSEARDLSIGQPLLAFPRHICPTVALHAFATVVRDAVATSQTWRVTARDR